MTWQERLERFGLELGPSVIGRIKIETPAAAVWQVIAEPGYLATCHPFCAKTEVIQWPGVGSMDTITYYSGISYKRNFVHWEEGVGYDLEIGEAPSLTSRVVWRIAPDSPVGCLFSIEVLPYLKTSLPAEKKRTYQERWFGDVFRHYLDCVVKGVRYKSVTGKAVSKKPNRWGHRWRIYWRCLGRWLPTVLRFGCVCAGFWTVDRQLC